MLAGVGGMVVFLGLWIEKEADEKNEKADSSSRKPYKTLNEYGWWILMFGIVAEALIAYGVAFWDEN